jgi:hypothetical protein
LTMTSRAEKERRIRDAMTEPMGASIISLFSNVSLPPVYLILHDLEQLWLLLGQVSARRRRKTPPDCSSGGAEVE